MLVSIIIPAYNEEKRIGKTLSAIYSYLAKQKYQSEIIVVDNGSEDRTAEIVEIYKSNIPNLSLIKEASYGKGWAVKQGMLAAKGDFRLFTDADNSTDISELAKLLRFAQNGYDVVVSSRLAKGAIVIHPQPGWRKTLGKVFAWIVHLLVPVKVKDTQNGFKIFSREAAEKIFSHQTIFYWAFDVEIIALAEKFKFKVKEVPIRWVNDDRSHMSMTGMVRMLFEVTLVRLHLMTRDYAS